MGVRMRDVLWVSRPAFQGWWEYLKVALSATVQLCSEWWFWEICALIVGYFGKKALAAHVSTLNMIAICFMPTIAVSSSASTMVGNALGANLPRKAKQATWLCVLLNSIVWTATAVLLFFCNHLIAEAYSTEIEVQNIIQRLILIYLVAGYFDNAQNIMGGALRGMGQLRLPAIVYLVTFYGVMLPLGCAFVWPEHMGVYGIWWSLCIGTGVAAVIFAVALCRADWFVLAAEASENMRQEGARAVTETGGNSVEQLANPQKGQISDGQSWEIKE